MVSNGYSRRCGPGDVKSTDRNRLLTDRNAYVTFLEEAVSEAEGVGTGLQHLKQRLEELEERQRSTARVAELAREHSHGISEGARTSHQQLEQLLLILDGRMQRIERAMTETPRQLEGRMKDLEQTAEAACAASKAAMARMRNEVSLEIHELGQQLNDRLQSQRERMDERIQAVRAFADDGTSAVIREAQSTCVRLADDALGATEAMQRKLEELGDNIEILQGRQKDLAQRMQGGLDSLRAEMNGTGSGDMAVKPAKPSATEAVLSEFKLKLERRVGHQLWQVSEAVRKIVQAMTLLQQHCGLRMDAAPASRVSKAAGPGASDAGCTANAASDPRWSVAIDDLYKGLQELEAPLFHGLAAN